MFKKAHSRLAKWVFLPLWVSLVAVSASAQEQEAAIGEAFEQLPQLDSDYQSLLHDYLSASSSSSSNTFTDIATLLINVQQAPNKIIGAGLLRANLDLMLNNTSTPSFQTLLEYLYQANDTATVKTVTERINQSSNSVAASQNYFLLAQYYYRRGNWQGVRAALSKVDTQHLAEGDAHYFHLLMGYALQALKEHRKAVSYYNNIPAASPYYSYAKLNHGTAFLRQGWWSEAHMQLEQAIANADSATDKELRDRLLVVMAYSQLNYEFYRDARKTLRRVSIDGAYTNKALMGLGLAAAYQEDFAGAINAFKLLTQKQPADLSVDEGHLLRAYAIVEVGDKPHAEIAYQEAITHYQNKLAELEELLQQLHRSSVASVSELVARLDQRAAEIYASDELVPEYFLDNYRGLASMQQNPATPAVQRQVNELQQQYRNQLKRMVSTNISLRKTMLESYLSQAKFGKAKLYDE